MKATVNRRALLRALMDAKYVAEPGRHTMPILGNVLLVVVDGALEVCATDLEVSLLTRLEGCDMEPEAGAVVVPLKALAAVVRACKDAAVTLETLEGERADRACWPDPTLVIGGAVKLAGTSADEYPALAGPMDGQPQLELDAVTLGEALGSVSYAASSDESRVNLCGVCLEPGAEAFRVVACDGPRLAYREVPIAGAWGEQGAFILPSRWVAAAERILREGAAELRFEEGTKGRVELRVPGARLTGRLVDGEFPNYRNVIPKENGSWAKLEADALRSALERVLPMTPEKSRGCKWTAEAGILRIEANNPDTGEAQAELVAELQAFPEVICFNARYVLQAVEASGAERLELQARNDKEPMMLLAGAGRPVAVVMPIRL